MIKLTGEDKSPLYFAPEQIANVQGNGGNLTMVYIAGTMMDCFLVTESPEEVVRKIMEYKLAMSTFDSAHAASLLPHERKGLYEYAEEELNRLAELEQTP
jgi:uncharacterized protein YlzI (FlbEa/FlbD family)